MEWRRGISTAWRSTRPTRSGPVLIGLLLAVGFVGAVMRAPRDQLLPLTVVAAIVLGLAGLLWVIVVVPRRLHPSLTDADLADLKAVEKVERREDRQRLQNETRTTLIQAIGGAALVAGLLFTWQQLQTDRDQQRITQAQLREQLTITRQGQAAERFTQAVEQLGSKDSPDVRLGGIYALERLAKTATDHNDRLTVYEVLTAFVRNHAPWPPRLPVQAPVELDPSKLLVLQSRSPDVQAALTVLGRRDRRSGDPPLDLSATDLRRARLLGAYLEGADLTGAHLERATLRAHLEGADLAGAHLEGADLSYARMARASLNDAHLEGALLTADLAEADLSDADLERTNLSYASMKGTLLLRARLNGADLRGANLEGAELGGARLEDAMANKHTTWPRGFDWRKAAVKQSP